MLVLAVLVVSNVLGGSDLGVLLGALAGIAAILIALMAGALIKRN